MPPVRRRPTPAAPWPAWITLACSMLAACGTDPGTAGSADAGERAADAGGHGAHLAHQPAGDEDAGHGATADLAYSFPCLARDEPTRAADFVAVYRDVLCRAGCTDAYCHGPRGSWAGLDLSTIPVAYRGLVGRPAGATEPVDGRPTCAGSELQRVAPGAPEQSLLYLKLAGRPPCGTPMPPPGAGWAPVGTDALQQVARWIEAGAPLHTP